MASDLKPIANNAGLFFTFGHSPKEKEPSFRASVSKIIIFLFIYLLANNAYLLVIISTYWPKSQIIGHFLADKLIVGQNIPKTSPYHPN